MIYGLGTDIVNISRIEKSIGRTPGFAEKVFTREEIVYSSDKARPAQHFAGMFAVKESFIKAFGIGLSAGMRFHDFEVRHLESGEPFIRLSGATQKIFDEKKLGRIFVSISHDTEYAVATVIIEKM